MSKSITKNTHCEYNDFKSVRYFHGMLMKERDFREEQLYHNKKRRLLNRMLHGWGVVCGLKITPTLTPSNRIIIEPGLAIDCAGNEILVCDPYELDVVDNLCESADGRLSNGDGCGGGGTGGTTKDKWHVVIKYKEFRTDPVAVYAPGGGCEEKSCEPSRIREGFCVELSQDIECRCIPLEEETEKNKCSFPCDELLYPCQPCDCCDDKHVVLGSITNIKKIRKEGNVKGGYINNWDCRRYVITPGLLQHWIRTLKGSIDLGDIVNYCEWAKKCDGDNHGTVVVKGDGGEKKRSKKKK